AFWNRVLTVNVKPSSQRLGVVPFFPSLVVANLRASRRRPCVGTAIMRSRQAVLTVSGNFFVVRPLHYVPAVSQGEFHAHPHHSSHQSENRFADDTPDLPQSGAVLAARRPPRRRRIHSARPIRSGADQIG